MSKDQARTDNGRPDAGASPLRIGVYICHCGGNISDVVDVARVTDACARLPNVVLARHETFMCSDPGQNLVADDIKEHDLHSVVVAACSPSLHELTFRRVLARSGLNPYLYEHANIREQVSWCSKSDPVGATDKAIRLVAAAVAKARELEALVPIRVEAHRRVTVIGGGVAGLRCALDLSRCGLRATLLERAPFLGGRMAQLEQVYPTGESARELVGGLLAEVTRDPNITVHTLAEVTAVSGYVGSFHLDVLLHPRGVTRELSAAELTRAVDVCPERTLNEFDYELAQRKALHLPYADCTPPIAAIDWNICTRCGECAKVLDEETVALEEEPRRIGLDVGSIVLATGFDHYRPAEGEYGYGQHPEVVTLPQLIRMMDEEGPTGGRLERNGRPIRSLCFIHCVGSRQVEGVHQPGPDGTLNTYCSRVCCTASLQAACSLKERFPDLNVYDFYQDIRTYGRGHEDYYEQASRQGVLFFRWKAESPPVVEPVADGSGAPLVVKVEDTLTFGEQVEVSVDLVVLASGMVPRDIRPLVEMIKLPRSTDRFLQEVHPKLRPVELAVNGVMIAGACQAPMDISESCAAASAAAVKVSALLSKGYIELDPFVAIVDAERCTGGIDCDAVCLDECKNLGAISLVEKQVGGRRVKVAEVNSALCMGCGMCAGACPLHAVEVAGWRQEQFDAMVDAIVADVA